MNTIKKLAIMMVLVGTSPVLAQEEDLYDLTLEDLMQIDIYSVSKKAESLFEAPLSSSTLTKDEITNSGATSIPEALRLIPGAIVREITNGVFDVHLRGFDNLTRFGDGSSAANQTTLVMVNGRPVFNNNLGGTYWEAIPVDLIDVERIEVVRGPAAAIYGPNAVSGVINIITKDVQDDFVANATYTNGTLNSHIAGLRLGYKFNEKLSAQVSANLQMRDRNDESYFSYNDNDYILDQDGTYETALDRKGMNVNLNYSLSEDFSVNLESGIQTSDVTKVYRQVSNSPLSLSEYNSKYARISLNKGGFKGNVTYVNGYDDLDMNASNIQLKYDYENVDANLEYNWSLTDNFTIRPGVNFQRSSYSDEEYINPAEGKFGVLGSEQTIESFAGSIMTDWNASEKFRLVAGGRFDKFNTPDDIYFSYEVAPTYKISDKHLVRAVVSRSNSGSFIGPNYLNVYLPPAFYYQANQEMDLFQIQLFELGYRVKVGNNFELNVEGFIQKADNTNALVAKAPEAPFVAGADYFEYENLPIEATQTGVTFSANYVASTSFQIKPFVTIQKTDARNVPSSLSSFGLSDLSDVENNQTPRVYGGFYMNYKATEKLNMNVNTYFMGEQTHYSFYDVLNPQSTAGQIDSNMILNMNISYQINDFIGVNVNGRNLLNDEKREFYGADRNGRLVMGGINIKF